MSKVRRDSHLFANRQSMSFYLSVPRQTYGVKLMKKY